MPPACRRRTRPGSPPWCQARELGFFCFVIPSCRTTMVWKAWQLVPGAGRAVRAGGNGGAAFGGGGTVGAGRCSTHCQAATFLVWHLQACAYCKVACKSRALQQILTAYMVRTCQTAATKRGTRRVTPLDPPCHSTSTSRAAGSFSTTLRLCFQDRRHLQQHRPLPGPHPGKDCSDRRPPGTQKILDIFI